VEAVVAMKGWRLGLLLVLLSLLAGVNLRLPDWHDRLFRPPLEGRTQLDVFLDLLGEMRTFAARMIYVRGDLYFHVMEGQGISWRDAPDILPIYRISTLLDPHMEEAYEVAAFDLTLNFDRPTEGLEFLDEGLRYNPDSVRLYLTRAFLLFQLKRYEEVVPTAGRALQLAEEHLDALNAVRLLAHSQNRAGNLRDEVHALRIWLSLEPGDTYPITRLQELGLKPVGFSEEELDRMQQEPPPRP
jgi:tetratricopeptide (TPR) repeat protein